MIMLIQAAVTNEKMTAIAQVAENSIGLPDPIVWSASQNGNLMLLKESSILKSVPVHSYQARPAARQKAAELTLDESGMILDCCATGEGLFEYKRIELLKQHISKLFPKLSEFSLITDGRINSQLGFLSRCNYPFLTRSANQKSFYSELNFVHLNHDGIKTLRLLVQS